MFFRLADGQFPLEQLLEQLDREVALFHAPHFGQELLGQDRDVGLLKAGGGEDVDDSFRRHCPRDDLANGVVQLFPGTRLPPGALGQNRPDGLKERHIVADPYRLLVRDGEREGL